MEGFPKIGLICGETPILGNGLVGRVWVFLREGFLKNLSLYKKRPVLFKSV